MRFCDKLKQLRAQKGISQDELSKKIFVSRSAVAKWENGLGLPSSDSLRLLAEFFGVKPSELLSDPETETVIVQKNGALSKRNISIIALSAFLIALLAVAVVMSALYVNTAPPPVTARELIFSTEIGIDTSGFAVYDDSEISADKEFADSRMFEIEHDVAGIKLPELVVKVTAGSRVTYESIDYDNLIVICSNNISLRREMLESEETGLYVFAADYYEIEFAEWANIKYGDLAISVKVFRNHIAVKSMNIWLMDNSDTIGVAQSKALNRGWLPLNASYTQYHYTIEKITKADGTEIDGDLSVYVSIENGYLITTEKLEIDSVIYVSATAEYDNVKSNILAVTVVRIPVERISCNPLFTAFESGESMEISFSAMPYSATFNVLGESFVVTLLTPEYATLAKTANGWLITASSDINAVGKVIEVKVETPEGVTRIFSWNIK